MHRKQCSSYALFMLIAWCAGAAMLAWGLSRVEAHPSVAWPQPWLLVTCRTLTTFDFACRKGWVIERAFSTVGECEQALGNYKDKHYLVLGCITWRR